MSLPNFQQLMLPTLHYLCQRFDDVHISRLEEDLGKALKLHLKKIRYIAKPSPPAIPISQ